MQTKVICMELEYRFLTLDDLPAIRKLSNSMDRRNDPKIGETAEGRIKDPLCDLYGAFTGEGELVGVGAITHIIRRLCLDRSCTDTWETSKNGCWDKDIQLWRRTGSAKELQSCCISDSNREHRVVSNR